MLKQEAGINYNHSGPTRGGISVAGAPADAAAAVGLPASEDLDARDKEDSEGFSGPAVKAESAFAVVQKHCANENETYRPEPHNDTQLIPLEAEFQPARPAGHDSQDRERNVA